MSAVHKVAILLVEDNDINQLVALGLLEALGYPDVTAAWNGQEALDACRAQAFDLVLMDCQMPVMDGLQATGELRALGFTMPVVALTAHAIVGDRERCLAAGMDDYMTKPIEPDVLAQMLQKWLRPASEP
jgi:CheY-like chemotaxis protein